MMKMVVTCKRNDRDDSFIIIPYNPEEPIDENNFVVSMEGETSGPGRLKYDLTVGREYLVYGIIAFNNQFRYLICDDENLPKFFPSRLFQISNKEISFDWEVAEYNTTESCLLIIGYPELTKEYASFRDLVCMTPKAVRAFLDYKEYIEKIL